MQEIEYGFASTTPHRAHGRAYPHPTRRRAFPCRCGSTRHHLRQSRSPSRSAPQSDRPALFPVQSATSPLLQTSAVLRPRCPQARRVRRRTISRSAARLSTAQSATLQALGGVRVTAYHPDLQRMAALALPPLRSTPMLTHSDSNTSTATMTSTTSFAYPIVPLARKALYICAES